MRLMPGTRDKPTALAVDFEGNALTTDRDTFAWCVDQIAAHPELSLGGPSMQWTRAALEEMARLYIAPLPNLPVLALLGGEETVVSSERDPQPDRRRCARAGCSTFPAPATRSSWSARRCSTRPGAASTTSSPRPGRRGLAAAG